MSDEAMAQRIRDEASRLVEALNAAARSGLLVSISFKPTESTHYANEDVTENSWRSSISVWRTKHV